jgi:hypothetical protein
VKYFLDTEFIEDGKTIDLLSIAIVCEDGRELYCENADADLSKANDWVRENVIPHLWFRQKDKAPMNAWSRDGGRGGLMSRDEIRREVRIFCHPESHSTPEFWADYGAYDWVALCQLFGPMIDIPEGWPMFCRDIQQVAAERGNPALPETEGTEHLALADARNCRARWEFLETCR